MTKQSETLTYDTAAEPTNQVATDPDFSAPRKRKLQRLLIALFILVILLCAAIGAAADVVYRRSQSVPQKPLVDQSSANPTSSSAPQPVTYANKEFLLAGTEVLLVENGQQIPFLTNVASVSAIRLGPDGDTLHFRSSVGAEDGRRLCTQLTPSNEGTYGQWTRTLPPWDFSALDSNMRLLPCRSGFLRKVPYFSYLEKTPTGEMFVHYENVESSKSNLVRINPSVFQGQTEEGTPLADYFWESSIPDAKGSYFIYPHEAVQAGPSLVIAFDRLIMAIDTDSNQITGSKYFTPKETENEYMMVADLYFFKHEDLSPFIVIESGWEGSAWLVGLIDISDKQFKLLSLRQLGNLPWFDFSKENKYIWSTASLQINWPLAENIPLESLIDEATLTKISDMDAVERSTVKRETEQKILQTGKYLQARCELSDGYGSGCEGFLGIKRYRYSSADGLKEL